MLYGCSNLPQHRPLFNFGRHFVRLGNHFLWLGNGFLVLGNDFVVLQNGFVRLGNGFLVLQNGFVALGNGFVALRNGFSRLGNDFRALQSLSRGHFFAKTGLGQEFLNIFCLKINALCFLMLDHVAEIGGFLGGGGRYEPFIKKDGSQLYSFRSLSQFSALKHGLD